MKQKKGLRTITQPFLMQYAGYLKQQEKAAVNGFLEFCGRNDLKLKPLKIQRDLFLREEKELTRTEYIRLVNAAERADNRRLSLVLQTICATSIRVSELQFITVKAITAGSAEVADKEKRRTVFLPERLRSVLKRYNRQQNRTAGPAQSAPSVCQDLLPPGKRPVPAGRYPGPCQRQHHPHLYHGKRPRPRKADRADGPRDHIISIM